MFTSFANLRCSYRRVFSTLSDNKRQPLRRFFKNSEPRFESLVIDSGLGQKKSVHIMATQLPHFAAGPIVEGFGRGSKSLGIPTANFSEDIVDKLPKDFAPGIYHCWASVDNNVYKGVMSIGWNPFYKNKKKSMETHILHDFSGPLHGKELRVVITGYIRPEKDFPSVDALVEEIKNDIAIAEKILDEPEMLKYKNNEFLRHGS